MDGTWTHTHSDPFHLWTVVTSLLSESKLTLTLSVGSILGDTQTVPDVKFVSAIVITLMIQS